jgi:hypothetical protein
VPCTVVMLGPSVLRRGGGILLSTSRAVESSAHFWAKRSRVGSKERLHSGNTRWVSSGNGAVESSAHFWAERSGAGSKARLRVGVTDSFMDVKVPGDVDSVVLYSSEKGGAGGGTPSSMALEICWSGLKIGEGDELYHSGEHAARLQDPNNPPPP